MYPERITDNRQTTGKLYHLRLRVECTLVCNLQSGARTNAALVIGLYDMLVIQLPSSLSHPGPLGNYVCCCIGIYWYSYLSCTDSIWTVKLPWLDKYFAISGHRPRYIFPATLFMLSDGRKRYSISAYFTEDIIKTIRRIISALFRQFGSCVGLFDISG